MGSFRDPVKHLTTAQLFVEVVPFSKSSQSKMILQVIYPFGTSVCEIGWKNAGIQLRHLNNALEVLACLEHTAILTVKQKFLMVSRKKGNTKTNFAVNAAY